MKTGKLTLTAMLLSVSFALSLIESFVPINALIPLPGLKLGFANLAVMTAYILCDKVCALCVSLLRPVLMLFLFGNVTSFVLSISGAVLAYFGLVVSVRLYERVFSFGGVSVICALLHSVGQIIAASFVVSDGAVFAYLPLLCAASGITGLLNGFIMNAVISRIGSIRRFV